MIEKLLKNILNDEIKSLNNAVQSGKEKVQKGEMSKDEYNIYLKMTFQYHLESLLDIKLDIAIPN